MAQGPALLLGWDPDFLATAKPHGSVVVCAMAGPMPSNNKEPVGQAFQTAVMRQQGLIDDPKSEDEDSDGSDSSSSKPHMPSPMASSQSLNEADMQPPPGVSWKKNKSKIKGKKKTHTDYYGLLGLQHERWMATEQQLRKAYQRTCLEHHPDKKLVGVEDEEEKAQHTEYFKTIQEAYEVLSDPAKRREYDSTDDFDDTLPTECDPADFFKVFAPAFRRNSRWSTDPNVPDVGDENTSWDEVNAFYDFWYTFKSWREFPHPDEEDVEGAESREHKRWIDRINSKLREKGKKEEGRRLREFVESAYRLDPRVIRRKEEEREAREQKKRDKELAKQRAIEEAERAKAEEEQRKKDAEEEAKRANAEAKKAREAEKKALKKERQRLRALADAGDTGERLMSEDDVERLCSSCDLPTLRALNNDASAEGLSRAEAAEVLAGGIRALEDAVGAAARAKQQALIDTENALKELAHKEHMRKMAAMREWSEDELRLLDKGTKKWPQGVPKRWENIASFIRTRTLEEVLLMVKERQGASTTRTKQQEDWKGAAKKRAEVTSQADLRCQAFTDVEVKLQGEAAASNLADANSAAAAASTTPAATANGTAKGTSTPSAKPAAAAAAAPAAEPAATPAAAASTAAPTANGVGPDASTSGKAAPSAAVGAAGSAEWSEEQELALVAALKQCGKEHPDRWTAVAALVPGKTKAQCFKRFKELRDAFRAKKAES